MNSIYGNCLSVQERKQDVVCIENKTRSAYYVIFIIYTWRTLKQIRKIMQTFFKHTSMYTMRYFMLSERFVWGIRNAWMRYRIRISSEQLDIIMRYRIRMSSEQLDILHLKTRPQTVPQHRAPHTNWHGAICQKHENLVWVQKEKFFDSAENNTWKNNFLSVCYKG
jgi:hypothetical protein